MKKLIIVAFALVTATSFGQQRHTGNPAVDSLVNDKDTVAVQQKLKKLGGGSEKDMLKVLNYYFNVPSKKDSVMHLLLQRFPKGDVAFNEAQRKLFSEDNPEKREQLLIKLKQEFPDRDMDQGNYVVSDAYAKNKNLPKMQEYLDQIKSTSSKRTAIGYNAQRIYKYDPVAADALLKPEILRLASAGIPQEVGPKGRYYSFFYLYSDILIKEEKYQEALPYIKAAYSYFIDKSDNMLTDYGLIMNKNGLHAEALTALQQLVDNGKATPEIKKVFTESYEKINPGKSAEDYIIKANDLLKIKTNAKISKMMISDKSPSFEVRNIKGKKISLTDFKGKIIVLDFWATWCGPCKASFPAMQRAVIKYEKDSNVKFLFIHTLERSADPLKDAKTYLSENHYNFDLYIDKKDPKTKKNNAVEAFGIQGIPAKFVIDRNGIIRFKLVGFSGSDDDAVTELSTMIELAKKNS